MSESINFLWYIVDNSPDDEKLKTLIAEAGLQYCLVPAGVRYNPYSLIKEADVMCMPSRYEGKPMVITESMILGVPPVVTEYLSAHDQIQSGIDGIVVKNDESIADALLKCARDKDCVARMKSYLTEHEYGNKSYIKELESKLFE